jgi:ABC-type sugar transport system permease subunit
MVFKIIQVVLLASVKYFYTLPYALVIGLEFEQAIIAVLVGGMGGFLFFYYLSKYVIHAFNFVWPHICNLVPQFIKRRYHELYKRSKVEKKVKIFTRKNRFLARFRKTYGFWGIILATPLLLSIPLGAFLARKYYRQRRHLVLYMMFSIVGWAAVLSGIVHLFPNVFLK